MNRKLYKSNTDKKIDGVCAGLAEFLEIDVTIIRLIWVCAVLFAGTGVLLYIIAALVVPRKPAAFQAPVINETPESNENQNPEA